jgi:Flp pilus assembly protein TadB
MNGEVLFAAALAAGAGWLAAGGPGRVIGRASTRVAAGSAGSASQFPAAARAGPKAQQDVPSTAAGAETPTGAEARAPGPSASGPRGARLAGALAGLAAWLLVGGSPGVVLGVLLAVLAPLGLRRFEPAAARRERLALLGSAPLVADLLAATLAAGVPVEQSLPVIARAVGGPAEGSLLLVHRRTQLGEAPESAWAVLDQRPGLGAIARSVSRSSRTGAPLAALLSAAAVDLRAEAAAVSRAEVRSTSVRAVLPLGLCLLPAFALLGIVPVVGGLLPSL